MSKKVIDKNFSASVIRDGKTVIVKKGQPFEFTDGEVADLTRAYGDDALRSPINEDSPAEDKKPATKGKKVAAESTDAL